jgi:hypothetical protein
MFVPTLYLTHTLHDSDYSRNLMFFISLH